MKICLGKEIEEVKKKDSENEKNLLKNRNSEDINELNEDDVYFNSNTVKNIKLGTNTVNRIYLNNSIVYELEDTIIASKFHSLVPATATSIIFDKLENQDITGYNLVGYCDVNNYIAVYNNNTEYLVLNMRNANNYSPTSCGSFFRNYTQLISLNFSNFNTLNVRSMSGMFHGCSSIRSLNLSNFNTQSVNDMGGMFYNCTSLLFLSLSNFNTQNVKNMVDMFSTCIYLKTIVSNSFSTTANPNSYNMFYSCGSIVGGNGTKFSQNHRNVEYARVDGENGLPGYFTAPNK